MNYSEKEVLQALGHVMDPDLGKDLVSLNMVRDVKIKGKKIKFSLMLTTPACPLKGKLKADCINAIKEQVDKDAEVVVDITSQITTKRQEDEEILPDVKNIIAVASGKGGVGKSTVAANLALGLASKDVKVGLLDADIFGPSIHFMMGLNDYNPDVADVDGKQIMEPAEKFGIKVISIGFLIDEKQAVVWRGPMASGALKQFFTDCNWGKLDYLIVDLPPGTSDIHLTLVQNVPVTGAVVVTTPQQISTIDAQKAIGMFNMENINVPVLGVVENMAYFTPAELPDNKYYIFGKDGGKTLAKEFNVPLLGQIPLVQSIREGSDKGNPSVIKSDKITTKIFEDLAQNVAQQVAIRNASSKPTEKVEIES